MTKRAALDFRDAAELIASIEEQCRQLRTMSGARSKATIAELERILREIRSAIPR